MSEPARNQPSQDQEDRWYDRDREYELTESDRHRTNAGAT
jgi:hypothetical protein